MNRSPVTRAESGATRERARPWLLLALVVPAAACRGAPASEGRPVRAERLHAWPSPAPSAPARAADVGDLLVTWDDAGRPLGASPRPLPGPRLPGLGWRCTGTGAERRCTDREAAAPPFRCEGERCVQRHPTLPDDGEWECADHAGIVVCRGGEPPAGTPKGASAAGYTCGPRGGAAPGERVCVDLSPDVPDGDPRGVRCRFDRAAGLVRICERASDAHRATDPCDTSHPCVSGLECAAGRCVPRWPRPSCFSDRDCDQSVCRFGSCTTGVP